MRTFFACAVRFAAAQAARQKEGLLSHAKRAAQCRRLLELLRAAGDRGVSTLDLIYKHGILRGSGRIMELRAQGHTIETKPGPGGTALYVLRAGPQSHLQFGAVRE